MLNAFERLRGAPGISGAFKSRAGGPRGPLKPPGKLAERSASFQAACAGPWGPMENYMGPRLDCHAPDKLARRLPEHAKMHQMRRLRSQESCRDFLGLQIAGRRPLGAPRRRLIAFNTHLNAFKCVQTHLNAFNMHLNAFKRI